MINNVRWCHLILLNDARTKSWIISWGTIIASSNPTFVSDMPILHSPRADVWRQVFFDVRHRLASPVYSFTNPVIISPRIIIQSGRGERLSRRVRPAFHDVTLLQRSCSFFSLTPRRVIYAVVSIAQSAGIFTGGHRGGHHANRLIMESEGALTK